MSDLTDQLFLSTQGYLPTDDPNWERQLDLEEEMRSAGIARFEAGVSANREKERESSNVSSRRMITHAHERVVEGIEEFFEQAKSGRAGVRHTAIKYLNGADADVLAHLSLRCLFDHVSMRTTLTRQASRIATLVEDELHFDLFKDKDKDIYEFTKKRISDTSQNPTYQRRVMSKHARTNGADWEEWTPDVRIKIGTKLVDIVIEKTDLFELVHQSEGSKKTNIYVQATKETVEWLSTENARLAPLAPVYLPTVMPPRPWTSPFRGGYWSGRVRSLRLIKTHNKAYLSDLESTDLSEVCSAVNAMQETAWSINPKVYEVMTHLWDTKSEIDCLPHGDDMPLPVEPAWLKPGMTKEDMTPAQLDEFKSWKSNRAAIYEDNAKAVSKRLQFSRMLWVAEKFRQEDAFYFPHQMDFRGRVYAVPLFLNPQGNDAAHGLLQFANSVPIGDEEGAKWLAIHGAGLWGVDKVSLEERVSWVLENEAEVLAAAEDPYSNRFWLTADKPWQALAFCFEWAGFQREGYEYESQMPVQMDGTCNGLQNFSAMLLDETGGRAVNLVPADQPNDIYQTVSDLVIKKLEAISAKCPEKTKTVKVKGDDERTVEVDSDGELARKWLAYGITRKVTKRPVMTLAYGASEFGFREMVYVDTIRPWKSSAKDAFPFTGSGFQAASFMGTLIWTCVGEVVVAARGAMVWLQAVAKIASKEGLPVVWTTPTGLKIMQEYKVSEQKRVELTFQQVRIRLSVDVATSRIDKRRQASGISPNWVHSMDAAHMQKTVNRCHASGIRSFSLIHDSYGTHAGNSWAMAQFLREEFVKMYSEADVLSEFADEIAMMLPDAKLPSLPPKGTLDLSQVLESRFFFA